MDLLLGIQIKFTQMYICPFCDIIMPTLLLPLQIGFMCKLFFITPS